MDPENRLKKLTVQHLARGDRWKIIEGARAKRWRASAPQCAAERRTRPFRLRRRGMLGFDDGPIVIDAQPLEAPLQQPMVAASSNGDASRRRVRWMPSIVAVRKRAHRWHPWCHMVAVASLITTLFLLCSLWRSLLIPLFDTAFQAVSLTSGGSDVSLLEGDDTVPKECMPDYTQLGECNAAHPWCRNSQNLTAAAACCSPSAASSRHSPAGTLYFCSYASATHGDDQASAASAGVLPPCKLNGIRPPKPDPSQPSNELRVYGLREEQTRAALAFSCFNSIRDPSDRLCIPQQYIMNIDCGTDDETLRSLLSTAYTDHVTMRGEPPGFQCFHRGGFGSVGWLHVHSFKDHADSICPTLNTAYGRSPNPLPQRYVCADGWRDVDARVQQMRQALQAVQTSVRADDTR